MVPRRDNRSIIHSLVSLIIFPGGFFFSKGEFNPGRAPLGTPLGAVVCRDAQVQVYWRNFEGHIAGSKHTSGWQPTKVINEIGPGAGFTVLEWDEGNLLRIYFEDYNKLLFEYCSDNGGETWFPGKQLSAT